MYNHSYMTTLAGKRSYVHHDAVSNADVKTRGNLKSEIR